MEKIEHVFESVRSRAAAIATDTGTGFSFDRFYVSEAAPTDPRIRDAVETSADALGLISLRMPSGAGHDAQSCCARSWHWTAAPWRADPTAGPTRPQAVAALGSFTR
jgi:hypothetical protein